MADIGYTSYLMLKVASWYKIFITCTNKLRAHGWRQVKVPEYRTHRHKSNSGMKGYHPEKKSCMHRHIKPNDSNNSNNYKISKVEKKVCVRVEYNFIRKWFLNKPMQADELHAILTNALLWMIPHSLCQGGW